MTDSVSRRFDPMRRRKSCAVSLNAANLPNSQRLWRSTIALPNVPPVPLDSIARGSRGWGAVAVVAVLLGMAALLFGGRLGFGVGSSGPPRPSFAGTQGLLADVSMVSPTEGWALAQVTKTPDGKTTPIR